MFVVKISTKQTLKICVSDVILMTIMISVGEIQRKIVM